MAEDARVVVVGALGRCGHVKLGAGPSGQTEPLRCARPAVEVTDVGPRCLKHAHAQRTRAVILANRMTLDRDERHDFAEFLVGHHGSWTTLGEQNARRIADALEGYVAVQHILNQRRKPA